MQTIKASVVVALTICIASVASATVTMHAGPNFVVNGDGNVANQFVVDFNNQLGTSQMRFVLSAGSFIGTTVVDNAVTPKPPIAASDNVTFIALGADSFTQGLNSSMLTPGASTDLNGPGGPMVFNATTIDISWAPKPPAPEDGTDFLMAQIVLSDDAAGELSLKFASGDGNNFLVCHFPYPAFFPLVGVSGNHQASSCGSEAGDYNDDGMINAADYTVWRDNLGAPAGMLPNDADGGVIGQAQYATWKANFGNTDSSSASVENVAVPEPATALLLTLAAAGAVLRHVGRCVKTR